MAIKLRQSTAVDIKMGPFLDETDGKTAETALTITQPDIRLAKNGGAWAQKNAAQTLSHEENGWYEVALDTTDTNTLGTLIVAIHESGALPVWREFQVVPAAVYDAMIDGTGNGIRADVQVLAANSITAGVIATGAIDADAIADGAIDAGAIAADAITAAKVAADVSAEIADAVWDEDATGHQTQGTFGQAIGDPGADADTIWGLANTNLDAAVSSRASASALGDVQSDTNDIQSRLPAALNGGRMASHVEAMSTDVITAAALSSAAIEKILKSVSGTTDSGTTTTIVDAERTEPDTDYWKDTIVIPTSGANQHIPRRVSAFDPAADRLTVDTAWPNAMAGGDTYIILRTAMQQASAGSDPWNTALPGAYGAGTAGKIVGDNLNATVSSRATATAVADVQTDVDDIQSRLPAALNGGRMAAHVEAMSNGVVTAAVIATDAIDGDAIAASAVTEIQSGLATAAALATVQADTDNIQTRLPASLTVAGRMRAHVEALDNDVITANVIATEAIDADALASSAVTEIADAVDSVGHWILRGTATSGTTTTLVDAALDQADVDFWKGALIKFRDGDLAGQSRRITGFNPTTDEITFYPPTTQPVSTHAYEIQPGAPVDVGLWRGLAPNALQGGRIDAHVGAMANNAITAAAIATDAIDNDAIAANAVTEIQAGLATASAVADIQTDTNDIQSRLPAALVGGRMDSSIGAIANGVITAAAAAVDFCNKVADHTLRRTYANARQSSDGDALNFRSFLGAMGKLVNRWRINGGILTVYQEDDATSTAPGGTQTVTGSAGADPITEINTD